MTDDHATIEESGPPATPAGDAETTPARRPITRGRRWLVRGVIVFATVLSLFTMVSMWANRLLFNPDNWENASTQLIQHPEVRNATANFVVDRLYAGYGEGAPQGRGPRQDRIEAEGNAYLEREFRRLDYVRRASAVAGRP